MAKIKLVVERTEDSEMLLLKAIDRNLIWALVHEDMLGPEVKQIEDRGDRPVIEIEVTYEKS